MSLSKNFSLLRDETLSCNRCPRLRTHCKTIAKIKKREFRDQEYLGLPVPGFGDERAEVLVVGLAPAAHGANRTGRMFTGDNSGLWLYRALFKAGFSNQVQSKDRNDALQLKKVYITATARCAPPQNKLSPEEIKQCRGFLQREIDLLTHVRVFLVLGQVALKGLWAVLPEKSKPQKALPRFSHGLVVHLKDGRWVICSFHPSQQNTFTKKLTEPMFDEVFEKAKNFLQS